MPMEVAVHVRASAAAAATTAATPRVAGVTATAQIRMPVGSRKCAPDICGCRASDLTAGSRVTRAALEAIFRTFIVGPAALAWTTSWATIAALCLSAFLPRLSTRIVIGRASAISKTTFALVPCPRATNAATPWLLRITTRRARRPTRSSWSSLLPARSTSPTAITRRSLSRRSVRSFAAAQDRMRNGEPEGPGISNNAVAHRHRDAGAARRCRIAASDKDAVQHGPEKDLVGGDPRFAVRRRFDDRPVFAIRIAVEHAAPIDVHPLPEPDRFGERIQAVAHQHSATLGATAVDAALYRSAWAGRVGPA